MISLVLCHTSLGQSQNVADSLKKVLRAVHESARLDVLYEILANENNRDSLILYSQQYLELYEKFGSEEHNIHRVYNNIAGAYQDKGELQKSLEYHFIALNNASNDTQYATSYSNIGSVYQNNGDYDNAYSNYLQAVSIFKNIKDTLRLGTSYISLGYTYYLDDRLDSAEYYLSSAKEIYTDYKIKYSDFYWSYAAGNLGLVLAKKGQIDESESLLSSAIEILDKYNDDYAISEYRIEQAKIYRGRDELGRAIDMATIGTELAKEHGYKKYISEGSELLAELYALTANYQLAYSYQSDFMLYKDSLTNADLIRRLANERTEFEVGQKQAEVDLLTVEKRTQRIVTIAIAAFAFLLIVLATIIYKYYRSKAKNNQILAEQKAELERLNSTKDKFFSIISHDLRSPVAGFNGISQMIKMMVESKQTDELLEMTEHIDSSVDQLSKLLDNLLNWAMQQQGHVPNVPEKLSLVEVSEDIVDTLSTMANSKSIELITEVPKNLELWADKNTTMTILRNLVSNSLKFTSEGGKVGIKATQVDGKAKIEVYDTGVGMPTDKLKKLFQLQDKKSTYGTSGEKGLGLGLQLVHEFMEMNNGTIEVTSKENEGTTFTLYLPLFDSVETAVSNT